MFEWNVHVHPRNEKYNVLSTPASLCGDFLNLTKFESKYGYVSIDTLKVTLEGMNEKGMTISPLIFESASYPRATKDLKSADVTLCSGALSQYVLGMYDKVEDLKKDLEANKISVFGPQSPEDGSEKSSALTLLRHLARLHWAVDDAYGGHIVIEIVDGTIAVHENEIGIMTNDPEYVWHLRNLNNFATMSPFWSNPFGTSNGLGGQISTSEIGVVPRIVSHGFNLLGLPGDGSPVSRFVRLFYLRQFAMMQRPPKELKEEVRKNSTIALVTGLLNSVWIVEGTLAKDPQHNETSYESTTFSAIKIPTDLEFYYRDYGNPRWKRIEISKLNFNFSSKDAPSPVNVVDGTIGVEDVTSRFIASS